MPFPANFKYMKATPLVVCTEEAYSKETEGIRVTVIPEHALQSSYPDERIYSFLYTVTIENIGLNDVQLLERHWLISSGGINIAEVIGPGVQGEQPSIHPGEAYEYTASVTIQDDSGSMEGSYTFRSGAGAYFEVTIPKFDLHYPSVIH